MRAILQRVTRASVATDGTVSGSIRHGLLVLLGIEENDTEQDIEWLSSKIVQMRIFSDREGKMNLSVQDTNGDLLIISQFTLFASTKKGNRPGFTRSAKPDIAIPLYGRFIAVAEQKLGKAVQKGVFGADMKVELLNDGPVTIFIDSKNPE
jgi:D-tyrosyl-tRNA(Tyr) deacylase